MILYLLLPPEWLTIKDKTAKPIQGYFTEDEILAYNEKGYNVYYYPNYPSILSNLSQFIKGSDVDIFNWVFVDLDMKHGAYGSKEDFIKNIYNFSVPPTKIIDSGNGIHVYWRVIDLDAMNYLKLQRRLMRNFNTDDAVAKIKQLMRVPDTANTKDENNYKLCETLADYDISCTCEELDKALAPLTFEDEQYCKNHYEKTYNLNNKEIEIDDKLPLKFAKLLASNNEVKNIWSGNVTDRSASDFRLAHIMFANGFDKDEAVSVLVNSAKALSRAPVHRLSYATNIVDKIWVYEEKSEESLNLSNSVKSILQKAGDAIKGTRFPCWSYIDNTEHGFRLGQVIGLVAGSGVGKTAVALNMFLGFVQNNPDYDHFFVPLEQPANEIAERWKSICNDKEYLYEKVQILSNYGDDGQFRHLSLGEIRDYILKYQKLTGRKVGSVVIDHIGALKKKSKEGENQALMDICHEMKAFAIETNTMLVMQSQAPRQKAGIGDLELDKDAAYGTMYFEAYVDYLITMHQPLKRCYSEGAPTITAIKFCKIRHKKQGIDKIQEDVLYKLFFDPSSQHLRTLTEDEEHSFKFFLAKATNKRSQDKKSELAEYISLKVEEYGKADNNNRT